MSNIQVNVIDGNNVNLQVTPQPRVDLVIDRGAPGPAGPLGPTGPQGQGLELTGSVATPANLPSVGQPGDQYFVQSTSTVYIWSNT
jgi:hypothetical protein